MFALRRIGLLLLVAAVVVGGWGVYAVAHLGRTWPYPRFLPDTIVYHGRYSYEQSGCHSRSWYDQHGGVSGAETAIRIATLRSALGVGSLAIYSLHRNAPNGYVLVASGDCFVMYISNAS